MGMVSRKIFPKSGSRIPGSARISILVLCLFFLFLKTADSRRSNCRVDQCNQKYERGNRRLEAREDQYSESDYKKRYCRVLKRYHRCLHRIRRVCRGNLLFHSVLQINVNKLDDAQCSSRSNKNLTPNPNNTSPTTTPLSSFSNATSEKSLINHGNVESECHLIKNPSYRHCGIFGDPHLRTFSDRFYTCNIVKAWPLVDNDHMTVMATNFPVEEGSEATVTTKITVLIKGHKNCSEQRMYVATSDQLPSAFVDGSSFSGSVFVVELEQGRHVEIHARHVATTMIIRRVARYLTFAIRLPNRLVSSSTSQQLCVLGCPKNQIKRTNQVASDSSGSESRSKRAIDEERHASDTDSLTESSNDVFVVKQNFTEESARSLCKRIILDSNSDKSDQEIELETKIKKENLNGNDKFKPLPSLALSDLDSDRNGHKRKKSGRKKMKRRKKSKPNPNLSSFRQLRWSQESNSDAILSEASSSEHHRQKGGKKRTKHEVSKPRNRSKSSRTFSQTDPGCQDRREETFDFNFYFDSCVFDLTTTGDANFTLTAKAALEDVKRTHELGVNAPGASLDAIKLWKPVKKKCGKTDSQTTPETDRNGNGASMKRTNAVALVLCVILAFVYVNQSSIFFASSINASDTPSRKTLKGFEDRTEKFFNNRAAT